MRLLPLLGLLLATAGAQAPASVTDIATVKVHGCGREAAFALADLVHGRNVTCAKRDTDRYGRLVGVCAVEGIGLGHALVEQGRVLPYPPYDGATCQGAERRAKAARRVLRAPRRCGQASRATGGTWTGMATGSAASEAERPGSATGGLPGR